MDHTQSDHAVVIAAAVLVGCVSDRVLSRTDARPSMVMVDRAHFLEVLKRIETAHPEVLAFVRQLAKEHKK